MSDGMAWARLRSWSARQDFRDLSDEASRWADEEVDRLAIQTAARALRYIALDADCLEFAQARARDALSLLDLLPPPEPRPAPSGRPGKESK